MSRGFFGVTSSIPTLLLDDKPIIRYQYETTPDIHVIFDKGTQDTYTYNWIINNDLLSTDLLKVHKLDSNVFNFTNKGFIGKTSVYCSVSGNHTNIIINTNTIDIYWNSLRATTQFDVSWNITNNSYVEYDGTAKDVYITSTIPHTVEYILTKQYAINAGEIAKTVITGVINHTGVLYSPTITVIPKQISLISTGPLILLWQNTIQTVPYSISGVVSQDTDYSVSGITGSDCNNYTAILSTNSKNYSLGTYQLNWKIIPSVPQNFTAIVSFDITNISLTWDFVGGCIYSIYNNDELIGTSNTTSWSLNCLPDSSYNLYVVATSITGTSNRTRIAKINTGHNSSNSVSEYDSGYITLSPCCLTGSKNGDIGLINWIQGTNGIIISNIYIKNCICNFRTTLLSGTSTRSVRFNRNNVLSNFPTTTSITVVNPYNDVVLYNVDASLQQTGSIINYTLRAIGTGWSTNNLLCPSGIFWFSADWRNVGTITTTIPRVETIITYL